MPGRPDNVELSPVDAVVQTSFTVMAGLGQVAAAHELSLTQLRMLAILRDREPKMAELAAHLGLEKSTVSGLVDRGVQRGLVVRRPSPDDARAVRVALSTHGHDLAATLTTEAEALLAPLLGRLAAREQTSLAVLLSRLLDQPTAPNG
jgi:DNA-binding MarR family transcriptional regulator